MCENGTLIPCAQSSYPDLCLYCDECATDRLPIIEQRRRTILRRMIDTGGYDPACKSCRDTIGTYENPSSAMAPRHSGSRYCQSGAIAAGGHRSHCTCDTCF